MDWAVAAVVIAGIVSVSWVVRSAIWARNHRMELELEYGGQTLDDRLYVLERDIELIQQTVGPEIVH